VFLSKNLDQNMPKIGIIFLEKRCKNRRSVGDSTFKTLLASGGWGPGSAIKPPLASGGWGPDPVLLFSCCCNLPYISARF